MSDAETNALPELSEEVISQDIETVNNIRTVSKELFTPKNIQGKTQLSAKQINGMARVLFTKRWLEGTINPATKKPYTMEENFEKMIDDIQVLSVSHERKSRAEFVETLKIQNAQAAKESFWGKLGGGTN